MWDSLLADQAHQDDPHLWERARRHGLELARFERDRRSAELHARIQRDFEGGIRAGVAETPTFFADGQPVGVDDLANIVR
jgi:protein-disulfide isomerase